LRQSSRGSCIKVGLVGYGKTGQAVAKIVSESEEVSLQWICRRNSGPVQASLEAIPIFSIYQDRDLAKYLKKASVDCIIDFSAPDALRLYGPIAAAEGISIISANSAHTADEIQFAKSLGEKTQVMCAPNITFGINFLLLAATALHRLAPQVDVAIVEEHFREKTEISGTAKRIASVLGVDEAEIRSLRLGGIIGSHQVVFGFPYQTLRLSHESISREAFGTGAIYAAKLLAQQDVGFYTYDQLLLSYLIEELQRMKGK
jgi:4-hydroxy-tetrahydrodipicolinate reductase